MWPFLKILYLIHSKTRHAVCVSIWLWIFLNIYKKPNMQLNHLSMKSLWIIEFSFFVLINTKQSLCLNDKKVAFTKYWVNASVAWTKALRLSGIASLKRTVPFLLGKYSSLQWIIDRGYWHFLPQNDSSPCTSIFLNINAEVLRRCRVCVSVSH